MTCIEWERETQRLRLLRDELNQLVKALHEPRRNGLSIRQALATAVAMRQAGRGSLGWARTVGISVTLLTHVALSVTAVLVLLGVV